ncbi:hypothetical protein MBLNU13_g04605t1 [Cladosporium sp. NU13]
MPALTPRNIAIGAGAVGAVAFLFPRSIKKVAPMENMFETQGVKNVGDRYAAQGGSNTHLPAVATPRGDPENTISNQTHAKGIGSGTFEQTQADQKVGYPTKTEAQFLKAQVGNEKGK